MINNTGKIVQIGLGAAAEAATRSGVAFSGVASQVASTLTSSHSGRTNPEFY